MMIYETQLDEIPSSARRLLHWRRRRLIRQEHMAVYLGISRYRLNKMEAGDSPIPLDIAIKALEVINRNNRDCVRYPSMLINLFRYDGYSMKLLYQATGIGPTRLRAIKKDRVKITDAELEILLSLPPKPHRPPKKRRRKR